MTAEDRLQSACVEWFDYAHPKLRLCLFAVPNGGKRHPKTANTMKLTGTRAGVADLIFYFKGNMHCFELKTKTGRQQPTQKAFEDTVRAQGATYRIVRSIESFAVEINSIINPQF